MRFRLRSLLGGVGIVAILLSILMLFRHLLVRPQQLINAAQQNDVKMVEQLIAKGTNVHASDSWGQTALMFAAMNGNAPIAKALLNAGAPIHTRDVWHSTALMYAAGWGNLEIVQMLLDAGADVNERSRMDRTPLIWAAGGGHDHVIRYLLDHGADPRSIDINGEAAADLADKNGFSATAILLRTQD
jgi:ankyrin repeat protein